MFVAGGAATEAGGAAAEAGTLSFPGKEISPSVSTCFFLCIMSHSCPLVVNKFTLCVVKSPARMEARLAVTTPNCARVTSSGGDGELQRIQADFLHDFVPFLFCIVQQVL